MEKFNSVDEMSVYIYAMNNGNDIIKMHTLCCMAFTPEAASAIDRLCKRFQLPAISENVDSEERLITRFTIRHISQGKYNAFITELNKIIGEDKIILEEVYIIFADKETEEDEDGKDC